MSGVCGGDGQPDLIGVADVAARFSVSEATVRRWVGAEELRAVDLPGRALRFHRSYIDLVLSAGVARANAQYDAGRVAAS